jgi:Domain of unknown function (DUF4440)
MTDQSTLTELNIDIAQWEQRRDEDAIQRLDGCLSEELVFRRADRTIVDKAAFMHALKGPSPFASRESRNVALTISRDRAVVILTVIGTRKDGTRGVYRNVRVFFRREDGWRMELWFNDDMTSLAEL